MRTFTTLVLSLVLAGGVAAQERIPTKQLAGPIDEMHSGVMATADPIASGTHSKSAMIPVDLTQTPDGLWHWQGDVAVEGGEFSMVLLAGEESWRIEMSQAALKARVPAHELAVAMERTSLEMGNGAIEGDYYRFSDLTPGTWTVSVEADAPLSPQGYLITSGDSPYRLLSYQAGGQQLLGGTIEFAAYGYRQALVEQSAANAGFLSEAFLRITTPAGDQLTRALFDDGQRGDGEAGDGFFGGSFEAAEVGDYIVQLVARGTTPEGTPFLRTAEHIVPVTAPALTLPQDFASADMGAKKRLTVSLAVDTFPGAPEKYRVFAEVWGLNAQGESRPVSWIGGMVYVENGQLNLGLDPRWIGLSEARSGFELRNVSIEEPNNFIPVAKVDRLDLHMPRLPQRALVAPKSLDEAMFMGPRPERAVAEKAGSRLLLVHGYCSGNVWGPQAGQFTNESIFLDTDKNRSHDAFAQLIWSFGNSYSSYGIVAHSQGGAAALHLYTYYWSGLDNATGGRLIQSVGTPYQGTALAGNAAVLGQIFGIGCGTNNDLTYSGASSWLSGVPSWARSAVNYYTTSFTDKWWRYDYCNLVTDVLLSDPDDGTTEKAKGQLSGGVNRGHKTGWCHTSGMRDPSQVTDGSRNSSMNSNAAN